MSDINSEQTDRPSLSWFRLIALLSLSTTAAFAQFTFTTFDVPGSLGTYPYAINNNGDVAGTWIDTSYFKHGFIRSAVGTFTVFEMPSLCSGEDCGVLAITAMNDLGEVAGWFRDTGCLSGFTNAGELLLGFYDGFNVRYYIRNAAGAYRAIPPSPFDVYSYNGFNNNGEVVGSAFGSAAFLLNLASNEFTFFDYDPTLQHWTGALALADDGTVLGVTPAIFAEPQTTIPQFFIRSPDGQSVRFFVPTVPTYPGQFSWVYGINQSGEIVGRYDGVDANSHGFLGAPSTGTAPPSISLLRIVPGPPEQAVFSVVDPISGIDDILTRSGNGPRQFPLNCTVEVAPFTPWAEGPHHGHGDEDRSRSKGGGWNRSHKHDGHAH